MKDILVIKYKGKKEKVKIISKKGDKVKLMRLDGPGTLTVPRKDLKEAKTPKNLITEISLLFESKQQKIGNIKYLVGIISNFSGLILRFTFDSNKDHDIFMQDPTAAKKEVEQFIKKKGFKSAYYKNDSLGGVSIVLDKDELLTKILK